MPGLFALSGTVPDVLAVVPGKMMIRAIVASRSVGYAANAIDGTIFR
jgi:hypothetical protein